jgi:uncharacterized protein (DUF2249 family)
MAVVAPARVKMETETATLDLTGMPAGQRLISLCEAFDRLAAGEALHLLTGQDPAPLLASLQSERKGLFEWSPLGQEGGALRVEVAKRSAAPGEQRRLTEALAWDHARLHGLLVQCVGALGSARAEDARRCLARLQHGLVRHIRFEELLLFPVFEARTGLPTTGPTAVLRDEHREILRLVEDWRQDPADLAVEAGALRELLAKHHRKEEAILYPTTDRLLAPSESDALVARIQGFRE